MKKFTLIAFAFTTANAFAQLPVSTAPQNKTAVLEEFTGVNCGYCPDGHRIGTQIYNADPTRVILINIHSGSFANPSAGQPDFRTTEGTAIDNMPNMYITGYPAGAMNREVLVGSYMATGRSSWTNMANTIKAQPAYVNVATQGTLDPQTRVLTVEVEVYYTGNSPVATNSLNVFLLEDRIPGPQSNYGNYFPENYNADGTYNHNHLLRKALTPTFGMTIPNTTSSSFFSTTLTYTVPATYGVAGKTTIPKLENLELVAFVTQTDEKIINANKGPIYLTNDAKAVSATVPVVCTSTFAPQVTVENKGLAAITALTITPSANGVVSNPTSWTGNLAPGATQVITLNSVNSSTNNGSQLFTYTITGVTPTDYYVNNNSVKVSYISGTSDLGAPVEEGFTLGAFPPAGWGLTNANQGKTWTRNTSVGGYGTSNQSTKMDFFTNTLVGDIDELYLPSMDLSGAAAPELYFDYAYAQKNSNSSDQLDVLVSDDCGANWTNVWTAQGFGLASTPNMVTSAFQPVAADNEWLTAMVSLTGFNKSSVMVKFVATNGGNGNNLFLDNINLAQRNPNAIGENGRSVFGVNVFPNPATSDVNIRINSASASTAKIAVVNTLGQVIFEKETSLSSGVNNVSVDVLSFPQGVYTVVVDTKDGSFNRKLTVTK